MATPRDEFWTFGTFPQPPRTPPASEDSGSGRIFSTVLRTTPSNDWQTPMCICMCMCMRMCMCMCICVYVYVYVYVGWLIDGELKGQNSSSGSSPDRGKDELLLPLAGADGDGT